MLLAGHTLSERNNFITTSVLFAEISAHKFDSGIYFGIILQIILTTKFMYHNIPAMIKYVGNWIYLFTFYWPACQRVYHPYQRAPQGYTHSDKLADLDANGAIQISIKLRHFRRLREAGTLLIHKQHIIFHSTERAGRMIIELTCAMFQNALC